MKRLAFLTLLAAASSCDGSGKTTPAPSFPGSAEIDRARAMLAEGKTATGAEALSDALRVVEESAPLRIANLTVAEDARGYGLFTPDADATIEPGKTLLLYFEPVGMTHGKQDGLWLLDLSADLVVTDAQGKVLQEEPDIVTSRVASRRPNREMHIGIRMTGVTIPEGDYVAQVRLKDRIGNETATDQVPFKVRVP